MLTSFIWANYWVHLPFESLKYLYNSDRDSGKSFYFAFYSVDVLKVFLAFGPHMLRLPVLVAGSVVHKPLEYYTLCPNVMRFSVLCCSIASFA
jgi:hypothetical protein